jgi:hypothetical protein
LQPPDFQPFSAQWAKTVEKLPGRDPKSMITLCQASHFTVVPAASTSARRLGWQEFQANKKDLHRCRSFVNWWAV